MLSIGMAVKSKIKRDTKLSIKWSITKYFLKCLLNWLWTGSTRDLQKPRRSERIVIQSAA